MNYSDITETEKERICDDYLNGIRITKLTKKYNHGQDCITKILDEKGIEHTVKKAHSRKTSQYTKKQEEKVLELYVDKHCGIIKIQKATNLTVGQINSILKKNNIKKRGYSESNIYLPQNQRKYKVNDDFFSTESHDMAYILGFIAADGCVSDKKLCIGLSKVDEEFLQKISEKLGSNKPLQHYTTKEGCEVVKMTIRSDKMVKDLNKYGIVPRKTFKFKFPENLSKEYWIDFIRGYFDGDGTICTSGENAIKSQICACKPQVLLTIVDFLYEEYGIPKVKVRQERENCWVFCYSIKSTVKFYEALYENKECMYLPRKKKKFDELTEKYSKYKKK